MTRDILLNSICPMSRVYDCCIADSDYDCDNCKQLTKEWLDEYDKHVIEQYKADTNLKDTIRDIHDNVAQEMYCKGIDDMCTEISSYFTYGYCGNVIDVFEIADKLKKGDKE